VNEGGDVSKSDKSEPPPFDVKIAQCLLGNQVVIGLNSVSNNESVHLPKSDYHLS
jgi:hypothetical protein